MLGADVEQLVVILPVAIYIGKQANSAELECALEILNKRTSSESLAKSAHERICLGLMSIYKRR